MIDREAQDENHDSGRDGVYRGNPGTRTELLVGCVRLGTCPEILEILMTKSLAFSQLPKCIKYDTFCICIQSVKPSVFGE